MTKFISHGYSAIAREMPWAQDTDRAQPGLAVGGEVLVEGRARVAVEEVVQIEPDVRPGRPETKNLRHAQIDRVDARTVHFALLHDVDRLGGGATGERASDGILHLLGRHLVVRIH
jgi:hypothetical protein